MPKGIYKRSETEFKRVRKLGLARLGSHCSIETRNKISLGSKGKPKSEEHCKNISLGKLGKKLGPFSKEHKNKIGLGNKGKIHTEEWKRKQSLSKKGRKITSHSEEHKRKISIAHKGKKQLPFSEEAKKKMSIAAYKRPPCSEETREKLRQNATRQIFPFMNTSIEIKVQNLLKNANIEFQTQYPIFGQPDIFIEPNVAIFCDGCYWHKCEKCGFVDKLKNEKDTKVTRELQKQGYVVIRLWEHEINNGKIEKLNSLIHT